MQLLAIVLALMLLSVSQSYAQVYIGASGSDWSGACDNSCPQSTPCQFSSSGSTNVANPCVLYLASGLSIPDQTLVANFAGNLTLSSLGEVSLAADFAITNRAGGVVLKDFASNGPNGFILTSAHTYIVDSSVTITDSSQITLSESSSVAIYYSNFTSVSSTFMCSSLVTDTVVDMLNVNLVSTLGIAQTTVNTAGDEPSFLIRGGHISGFTFSTSQLKKVTLENVIATMTTSTNIFETAPVDTISITDSNITSALSSWLVASGSGDISTLNIVRSHFVNVALRAAALTVVLDSSTFTLDELYDPVVELSHLASLTLSTVSIGTSTASGSGSVLSSFTTSSNMEWTVSNIVYTSPSTVPRMRFGGLTLQMNSDITFPSVDIADTGMQISGSGPFGFSGDITTPYSSAVLSFASNPAFIFHSISIDPNIEINCVGSPSFTYIATKPEHGIECKGGPGCVRLPSHPIEVSWESSQPLPSIDVLYPFLNTTVSSTFTSTSSEFTLTSSNANSISFFSFQEVPCAANCVPASSGPCVSRTKCTCKPGYEGVNCEIGFAPSVPTSAPVEIAIPITPPAETSPVSAPSTSAPSTSAPSPSSSPSTSTPSSAPSTSTPSSAPSTGNPPSSAPSANTPSANSPTQSPGATPTDAPSGIPVSNSPDTPTSAASQQLSSGILSFGLVFSLLFWFY